MFNPTRLSLVRKRMRLTAKGFAELIGVSPVTITRLEKGNNEPDNETINMIMKYSGFPRDFFYGDDLDELSKETASFRSLTSMTAKERDGALSAGALAYLFSDWVNAKFNLPQMDLLDFGQEADPAAAAISLRQYWSLGEQPISDMVKLLESKGVRVFSLSENTKNVDAFSCWRNDIPYIFLNVFKSAERTRFDAAHELGHLVLHRHGGANSNAPQGREVENDANSFASSFLMPEADVKSRIPYISSLDKIVICKKRWGVSVAALAYRLHKLDILTDWQYRSICIQLNKRGYNKHEPKALKREQSAIWQKVFSHLWDEKISRAHIANEISIPLAELDSLVFGLLTDIKEHSPLKKKPTLRIV